ncbi:MAG: hypothetical protein EOP06_16600, partial [Proteobacteria bacterium]
MLYVSSLNRNFTIAVFAIFCLLSTGCGKLASSITSDIFCEQEPSHSRYQAGSGTVTLPFVICTPAQLLTLAKTESDWGSSFVLARTIDVSSLSNMTPIGRYAADGSVTAAPFTGNFEGAGNAINGLKIDMTSTPALSAGLFGYIKGGTFKNLAITGADITALNTSALFAGFAENVSTENISVIGVLRYPVGATGGQTIAGLFAHYLASDAQTHTIANTVLDVTLTANDLVGGMIGRGTISGGGTVNFSGSTLDVKMLSPSTSSGNTWGGIGGYVAATASSTLNFSDIKGKIYIRLAPGGGAFVSCGFGTISSISSTTLLTKTTLSIDIQTPGEFLSGTAGGFIAHGWSQNSGATLKISKIGVEGNFAHTTLTAGRGIISSFAAIIETYTNASLEISDSYSNVDLVISSSAANDLGGIIGIEQGLNVKV